MWESVTRFIHNYDSFVITSHVNPDGDAVGSEIALAACLEELDKRAIIVNSSPAPVGTKFLDPYGDIKVYPHEVGAEVLGQVDAVFILDVNNWEHLGAFAKPLKKSVLPRACIDHHEGASEDFAEIIISDTKYAAAGLLIYDLAKHLKVGINRVIANAIYAALITDTGTFRFSNTDRRAFTVAAELCDKGVDPFALHRDVFGNKTWGAGHLLGPVLGTIDHNENGRLVWITVTQDMFKQVGATYDDSDGFIDLIRAIKGVELALFFKETNESAIKVSLRSNGNVDAYAISHHFGGGGHKMAAGMRVDGPLDVAIAKVVAACEQMDGIRD